MNINKEYFKKNFNFIICLTISIIITSTCVILLNISNKIKNNELDIDALERELKIIRDLVENDLHIRNRTITNNSYRSNTPKRKNSLSKGKISNKEDNVNAYIEPVNFANILRGNNERKKSTSKSKRMNSKEKKKDTLI